MIERATSDEIEYALFNDRSLGNKVWLSEESVKEIIEKHIIGSNLVRSKVCEKPYGDSCGYCYKCNQNQELVINAIVKDLECDE